MKATIRSTSTLLKRDSTSVPLQISLTSEPSLLVANLQNLRTTGIVMLVSLLSWPRVSPVGCIVQTSGSTTVLNMVYSCPVITIAIDRDLATSVYDQVAAQIRELIAAGALTPGTSLPSVRQLAGDLGVGLNTIARAYRRLQEEGFLEIRGRSGVSVAAPADTMPDEGHHELNRQLRVVLSRLRQAGVKQEAVMQLIAQEIQYIYRGSSYE